MPPTPRFRAFLWLLTWLALPAVSFAQEAGGDAGAELTDASVESARALFQRGAEHARRQQWREALDAFEQSARARPHPATTFNLGFCERALGHRTRARKLFARALDEGRVQMPGELSEEARSQAERYLTEVEKALARVTIELEPDAAIAVDGRPLEVVASPPLTLSAGTRDPGSPERPPLSRFLLLVDPGERVFVVAREGRPDTLTKHVFEPGASTSLSLIAPAPTPPPASSSATRSRPTERPPAESRRKPPLAASASNSIPAYAAFGVGAVGLLVGVVTGIAALDLAGELDGVCPTRTKCPSDRAGDVDRLDRLTIISDVSFAVAATGTLTGVVLLLTAAPANPRDESQRAAHGVTLELFAGSGSIGLRGRH